MGNIAREVFTANGTFTAKAGVTRVKVIAENLNGLRFGGNGGTNVVSQPDGTTWAYGAGSNGQIGNGAAVAVSVPTLVSGGLKFTSLFNFGGNAIFGIDQNGAMWSWGASSNGVLGIGNTTGQSSPNVVIGSLRWAYFPSFIPQFQGASNNVMMAAIDVNQNLWTWGANAVGNLGNNGVTAQSSPNLVVGGLKFKQVVWMLNGGGSNVTTLGLTTAGTLYTWGLNNNGALGNGSNNTALAVSSPVLVVGGGTYSSIFTDGANMFGAVDTSGNIWTWGTHFRGVTGQGLNTGSVSSPVQVQGAVKFLSARASYNQPAFGISTANDLYCIGGLNNVGQTGNGNGAITGVSSPTLVVGGLKWSAIACSNVGTMWGITTAGDLYGWGGNNFGQIGNGASGTNMSSPVLAVGGLKWSFVNDDPGTTASTQVASGVDTQGQVWQWGANAVGNLGNGTIVSSSSPVQSIPPKQYNSLYPQNVFFLDVVPGTAYTITIAAAMPTFGTRALGIGASQVTVEYAV